MTMSLTSEETARRVIMVTWTWQVIAILFFLVMLPIWVPLMPVIEGTLFPVTGKVAFVDVHPVDGGLSVRLQFTKLRDCEYLGVAADRDGISVDFYPVAGGLPITLPTGDRLSRPWKIGTTNLEGVRLRWVHRCVSPFWTVWTIGYP